MSRTTLIFKFLASDLIFGITTNLLIILPACHAIFYIESVIDNEV